MLPCTFLFRQKIPYYQWVPFILIAQAILFYAPSVIWNAMNGRAGVDTDNIMAAARTFDKTDKVENKERTLYIIRNQINR